MELGRYIDGRTLTFDQSTGTFRIGDAPVSPDQIRGYVAQGHIAWASADIALWFNRAFPAAPAASRAPANSGVVIAIIIAVVLVLFFICGIFAAIAVPTFSTAKVTAQKRACYANERTIEGAAQVYKAEHGTTPDTIDALVPEFLSTKPVCPTGGTYSWDPETGKVTCSKHGNYADEGASQP